MTRKNDDSRKRPSGDEGDNHQYKRSSYGKPLLKLLVPNFIAGKLIGKGGSNLSEIKTLFSAHIQVSSNNEFYPGTDERIVTISTDSDNLKEFISYMIETVQVDKEGEKGPLNTGNLDLKIVVTNLGAGLVIGKGGATIQAIKDESHAKVFLSKREGSHVESERVLVIMGTNEQRLKACSQIIDNMSDDPDKMCNGNIKYYSAPVAHSNHHASAAPQSFSTGGGGGGHSMFNNHQSDTPAYLYNDGGPPQRQPLGHSDNSYNNFHYEPRSTCKFYGQMEVPDGMVGAILGKQGQSIKEISLSSGAKIKFSAKDEYVPGTTNRILTLRGNPHQIHTAYTIVDQKVAQVEHDINTGVFTPRR